MTNRLDQKKSYSAFPSALLNTDNRTFAEYLQSKSKEITRAISDIFHGDPESSSDITDLKSQLAKSLATEKDYLTALEKNRVQREQLEGQLENASLRYMVAEKRVDRQKSATVAKLEAQAIAGGQNDTGSGLGRSSDDATTDTKAEGNEQVLFEAEKARKQAVAASAKQQKQIEELEAENEKSRAENATLAARLTHLSDDDYSKTDLFKHMRSQYEDYVKRVNDLEARLTQLRDEAEKDQTSRTAFRMEIEREMQPAQVERDAQLAQAESDLARVRDSRDQYLADNNMRKAAQAQERNSIDHINQLVSSKDQRIKALESEVERLQIQNTAANDESQEEANPSDQSVQELLAKCAQFERKKTMLETELQSMQQAYTKASTLASQKVANLKELEDKVMRAQAEKSRADQKYFAAMKLSDTQAQELKALRAQNSKSSEAVSNVKEAEEASRTHSAILEKQITELNSVKTASAKQLQTAQQSLNEKSIQYEGLKTQVQEMKKLLTGSETTASMAKNALRKAEVELEKLKATLEATEEKLDRLKERSSGVPVSDAEGFRVCIPFSMRPNASADDAVKELALCTVCRAEFKDTVLTSCGHVFCKKCIDERTMSRMRKCPNCNRSFGHGDVLKITL